MSIERDQAHTSASTAAPSTDHDDVQPGRSSRSALLRKPDHAVASGLLSRKARDANGVATGAEDAVSTASSSSGSALPANLQRKFESSLGADLSGVRVHTGSQSAAANDAVGARAYTMGNDIHFGAGQYDPSSSSGEHLLAHEVAHTVQQSGGAARRQYKLEVSSPNDALEHEADRAADAMIVGASATVSGAVQRVHRKEDEKYDPSGYDVASIGDDTPRELDWRKNATPVYTDLGTTPPEIINPKLTYDPARAAAHPEAVQALDGVGNDCFARYGSLTKTLEAFRKTVAEAEKASSGAAAGAKDPMKGLDNTKPEASGVKVGDAFAGNKVNIIDPNEAALDAASSTEQTEIIALKKAVALSATDVRDAENDIADALDDVGTAHGNVRKAVIGISKAENAAKKADNEAQASQIENTKSSVEHKVKAFTNLVAVAKGLAKLGDKEKVNEGLMEAGEAAFELVVSSQTSKYDHKIEELKTSSVELEISNASLDKEEAVINYNEAVAGVRKAVRAVDKANTAYKKAVNERIAKYNDLSTKMEAAMIKNGVPPGDVKRAKAAIQAVPLIEETLAKLKGLSAAAEPPEYTAASGQGASMCTNIGMVLAMVGLLKGYRLAADSAHMDWSKRLASVKELLDAAVVNT